MAKRALYLFVGVVVLGIYLVKMNPGYGLSINQSSSLPYHLFIAKPLRGISKGKIIAFNHPEFGVKLAKIVAGLPGDRIEIRYNHVFVGENDCGQLVYISKTGRRYTPISEGIVPEGYVFASATHPESFDSRYAEFGLVKQQWILGELWPLF